jgi:succinate-semialdehyde dehydrogenase/glutarate-semialdehyde dehydrogenase
MSDYAVVNPATGETLQTYPTITDAELDDAIGRADAAHRAWAASSTVEERAGLLKRLAGLYNDQAQRLGEIIVSEMGKPIEQAVGEVEFSAAIYDYYADNAASLLADEEIEPAEGGGTAVVRRSSYGLLLGIMPWNYPYYQVARFAAPNLAIGNTMLLKHAPQCPESAAAMEELFHEAGFPQDVYINIYATNDQITDVIADPRPRAAT